MQVIVRPGIFVSLLGIQMDIINIEPGKYVLDSLHITLIRQDDEKIKWKRRHEGTLEFEIE